MVVRLLQPWRPMQQFRREMDRLLSHFPWDVMRGGAGFVAVQPAVNLWETADSVYVEFELPGVKTEDLDISAIGQGLVVKGRWPDYRAENAAEHRRERPMGEFTKVVSLPTEVDPAKVEARIENGVLRIVLAKVEAAKPRKISVMKGV